MIRVLIADDHTIVRKGLKEILADNPNIEVMGEAGNGEEVLNEISIRDYDVLLLDITMPVRSGLDIIKESKKIKPQLNILVLSMHPEEHYALRALREGASGYLTKSSAPDELLGAIEKVSTGGRYITLALAEKMASDIGKGIEKPLHCTLSNREYEVMCMIASGKTITDIAKQMMLSVKTVSTYRSRVIEKLNLKTNADIIRYALQYELVS